MATVATMKQCAILPLTHPGDLDAATTPVAGEGPLVRVLRSVLGAVPESDVVVVTPPVLADAVVACLRAAGLSIAVAVAHGPTRRQAVRVGLEHLDVQPHSSASVLICDHRHPLSRVEVAHRVLAAVADGAEVVVPIVAMTDSVKTVDESGSVLGTVDRATLRTVQYPRGFTAAALWQLISTSSASDDEFDAALRAGLDVGVVDGDADAFQVEMPRDGALLDAVIACRPD